jgi:DNA-binding transcriptional regulator YhcF (GntR family)
LPGASSEAAVVTLFSREDMGAMLDLKLETVSRTLNAFIREGLLEPMDRQGRVYRLLDEARLASPKD